MKKNLITIIVIIIIIVALVAGFYWFYFKPKTEVLEQPTSFTGEGTLPTVSTAPYSSSTIDEGISIQPVLKSLVNSKNILTFWQSATSTLQYLTPDGLFEINYSDASFEEKQKDLGVNFSKILSIEPSTKGKVLIKYLAAGATKSAYSILDINNQELKNLDLNIKSATWAPDGDSLFFYYSNSPLYYQENFKESSYLGQLDKNLNFNNKKILMNFKVASDINLLWPNANTSYLIEKPTGLSESTILSLDIKNKIFKPFVSGHGLILKWDSLGKYGLLFSVNPNSQQPKLSLINKDALVLAEIPNITLPEKCVFAKNRPFLYCSIFINPTFEGVWPDSYYMGLNPFDEMIYEINLETLEAKLLNNNTFRVSNINISNDDGFLFFFDDKTQILYSLSLPSQVAPNSMPITISNTPSISPTSIPNSTSTKSFATTSPTVSVTSTAKNIQSTSTSSTTR